MGVPVQEAVAVVRKSQRHNEGHFYPEVVPGLSASTHHLFLIDNPRVSDPLAPKSHNIPFSVPTGHFTPQ